MATRKRPPRPPDNLSTVPRFSGLETVHGGYQGPRPPSRKKKRFQLNRDGLQISEEQHARLLEYMKMLLDMGSSIRDTQIIRYREIDREVYGYLVLDEDDQKRAADNSRGFGVKPTDVKLPLTLVRMEEVITYMLLVLAPDEGIYNAIAPAEHQKSAKAFSRLMNEHAQYFGHYRQFGMFLFDALKYNFGAMLTEWREIFGNIIGSDDVTGELDIIKEQVVQAGNELLALDPYNTLYDPAVDPLRCYREGEFCAYTEIRREFWIERAGRRGEFFNIEEALGSRSGGGLGGYFRQRPVIDPQFYQALHGVGQGRNPGDDTAVDYFSLLSMNPSYTPWAEHQTHEVTYVWLQLYPNKWGLGPEDELQIWRMTVVNGSYIVEAVRQANAHGHLPMVFSMPNEDGFRWQTKSWAEYLTPFNRFASQQMNVHQRANRRRLYGLLFYDKNLFPDLESGEHDLLAGKIPFDAQAQDVDVRSRIMHIGDGPDTDNTIETIGALDDLMEKVLPSQMAPQVASLERATQYQAAATVQSANRRNLKMAKIIDSQAITVCRHMQMYNILQFQPVIEIIDDVGELLQVDPKAFRDAKLQFSISDGLRGLDKLTLILHIKEALAAVLQSQQAAAQVDVVKLLDYWSSLIGDNTDFSQFRLQSPIDALPVEERNAAFQLLQQVQQQQPQGGT